MAKLKKEQLAIGSFHYAFYPFEDFCDSMRRFGVTNVEIGGSLPLPRAERLPL